MHAYIYIQYNIYEYIYTPINYKYIFRCPKRVEGRKGVRCEIEESSSPITHSLIIFLYVLLCVNCWSQSGYEYVITVRRTDGLPMMHICTYMYRLQMYTIFVCMFGLFLGFKERGGSHISHHCRCVRHPSKKELCRSIIYRERVSSNI